MPINEYLKMAAAQLRKASDVRKQEAAELRRQMNNIDSEKGTQIQQLRVQEQQTMDEARRADSGQERAVNEQRVLIMRRKENDIDNERKNAKNDLLNRATALEQESQQLASEASAMETRASTST